MSSPAFSVVDLFEQKMAEFAGAKYGVALASCTDALFLCFKYRKAREVIFPARTYISAVSAAIHAGAKITFLEQEWSGIYRITPTDIWDGAVRMKKGMYQGGLHCVSFQASKALSIGRGGMVLTNDKKAVEWLKLARHDGRHVDVPFKLDDIQMVGWNCYMSPEQAARGLQLLEGIGSGVEDRFCSDDYPDLRNMSIFKNGLVC